jgi:c-di-GMP-related signal transduction protein
MEKITGQQLKKDIEATERKLKNLQHKAQKKFHLIMDDYQEYIPQQHKDYLTKVSYMDIGLKGRLDIVIATEAEYVKRNSNQGDLFNQ